MVDNPLTRPYFWGGWRGVALDSHDMIYESCLKNVHFPVDPNYPLKKSLFEPPKKIYIYNYIYIYNDTSNRFSRVNWGQQEKSWRFTSTKNNNLGCSVARPSPYNLFEDID